MLIIIDIVVWHRTEEWAKIIEISVWPKQGRKGKDEQVPGLKA